MLGRFRLTKQLLILGLEALKPLLDLLPASTDAFVLLLRLTQLLVSLAKKCLALGQLAIE